MRELRLQSGPARLPALNALRASGVSPWCSAGGMGLYRMREIAGSAELMSGGQVGEVAIAIGEYHAI